MDLQTLSVFRTVAREEGVTRAASLLGLAPSNVTTRIQKLETELGTQLFDRVRKRMIVSEEGQVFLDYAERILSLADEARQRLKGTGTSGRVRVGSMEATLASRLTEPLSKFRCDWPKLEISLVSGSSRQLMEMLRIHQIDCALIAFQSDHEKELAADLETTPLFCEELVLLLPPDHPEVRTPADLRIRTLAAFASGCSYRTIAENWLMSGGHWPLRVQEVPSYHAMYGCTVAGSCISIMPRSVARHAGFLKSVRELHLAEMVTYLACRKGFNTSAYCALRTNLIEASDLC